MIGCIHSLQDTTHEGGFAERMTEESVSKSTERPTGEVVVKQELDCRGLNCPLPIIKTKKAIDGLASGEVLKMIATDPGSIPDVNAFSRRTGHELVSSEESDGEHTFLLRKK